MSLLLDALSVEYFEARASEQGVQGLINQVLAEYIHNRDRQFGLRGSTHSIHYRNHLSVIYRFIRYNFPRRYKPNESLCQALLADVDKNIFIQQGFLACISYYY